MLKKLILLACVTALLAASTAQAAPRNRKRVKENVGFSDQAVAEAIRKGMDGLFDLQQDDGSWGDYGGYPTGPTAMVTYALLAGGVNPQDPRIQKALDWLAENETVKTYCLGLRCFAWHLANKDTLAKYRDLLKKEAAILINSTADGSYGYTSNGTPAGGDSSNSQYGLLGVWAAADDGNIEIPSEYWSKVMKMWEGRQCDDGGWSYGGKAVEGSHTMTAAGVASLFVCYDYSGLADANPGKEYPPLKRGLEWFDKNFKINVGGWTLYYLYGVERVGLAAGYKYFGDHDWYKEGATYLLQQQNAQTGTWAGSGGAPVGTSFALLFLIRGRHPVLFNKLETNGDWNRRQRDMAAVTRWVSYNFETEVNWQIINLKHPVSEWDDASILYITGTTDPKFTEQDFERIKAFVERGGMIFTIVQSGGTKFSQAMKYAYTKMFPGEYTALKPVGKNHLLNHIYFKIDKPAPIFEVHNGARPLVVHCEEDLARQWQSARATTAKNSREYEIAFNVVLYGVDRMSALPPRGYETWPSTDGIEPTKTVKVTRVQHGGNWDPEPKAWQRFADMMLAYRETKVDVEGPVSLASLATSGAKVAVMTGAGSVTFTPAEAQAVKDYVYAGGTLVIDAAGGSPDFAGCVESMLRNAFGGPFGQLQQLAITSPVYMLTDMEISTCGFRRLTADRLTDNEPKLKAVLVNGDRPGVIFSSLDLTAGLAACRSGGIDGYDIDSAFDLMRNIVLYTNSVDAKPVTPPTAPTTDPETTTDLKVPEGTEF